MHGLTLKFFTKSREKININNNFNASWGWGWGYGWGYNPWMWNYMNQVNVNQYTEGTLFVDIIDRSDNELVWQGITSGALKMKSPEKRAARINQFVKEIFKTYPPDTNK